MILFIYLLRKKTRALYYDKLFIKAIDSFINKSNNVNNNVDIEENLKQVTIHDSNNLEVIKL